MNEKLGESVQSEGARRLELIGRLDLIGKTITLTDGRVVDAETFSCGPGADAVFEGINATTDPEEKQEMIEAAKAVFEAHFDNLNLIKPE